MLGRSCSRSASATAAGTALRRTGRTAAPGRAGHAAGGLPPPRALARHDDHALRRLAARGGEEAVDRGRALVGVLTLDYRRLEAARPRGVRAEADDLRVAREVGPARLEAVEGVLRDGGHVAAVAHEQRRADRGAGQYGAGHGTLPVVLVDEHDGGGPCGVAGGGEDRGGDAGGVGCRVAAADADRVLRRARGEAELGRGLRVVRGGAAELGRAARLVAEAASGDGA